MIRIKRVYESPSEEDGTRVLVDRLWPRGLSRERARADLWLKEIAPSDDLRKWFGHDPERWKEFTLRYRDELKEKKEGVEKIRELAGKGDVTLLFAAKDEEHNNAVVLRDYLEETRD